MKASRLFSRWRRRNRKLLAELQELLRTSRADGDVEGIHQLRVTLRRLRLYVRFARPCFDPGVVLTMRRWAKGVAQATGLVRDYDVAIECASAAPDTAEALVRLRVRRDRAWRRSKRVIKPVPPSVVEGVTHLKGGLKQEARLKKRLSRQLRKLGESVHKRTPGFFELDLPAQHDFRRALRWWRYLRELELPRRRHKRDRLLKRMIRLQEALGEHQNRAVTLSLLSSLGPEVELSRLRHRLAREQGLWAARIRQGLKALA